MYYLYYSTSKYDEYQLSIFNTETEALTYINRYINNDGFQFKLVYGSEVKVVPVSTVTKYKIVH